ncbi:MAG: hypothetical protein IJU44_09070 [Kiritimatiellae bacterium]|nr:hypothetical protein [Kiritimatiellia bacterium]
MKLPILPFLVFAAGIAAAAPSFKAEKPYPAIGLKFKTLSGGNPEPLKQAQTHTYTRTDNQTGATDELELFSARELWYATQHLGQWRDKAGNLMILGRADYALPKVRVTAGTHVSREDFEQAAADNNLRIGQVDITDNRLLSWVGDFADAKPGEPEKIRCPFRIRDAAFVPTDHPQQVACLFRIKSQLPAADDWYCLIIEIADGTPTAKVRKDIETQFLATISAIPRSSTTTRADNKELKTFTPGTRTPEKIADHPSRDAAKKSIANMAGWWYAETADYIFLSDVRSSLGKNLVKTFQTILPDYRKALKKLVPPFVEQTDVNVVRIFENEADYKRHVGPKHEFSDGIWNPALRELAILSCGNKKAEETMDIMRHEGFHQYLFYAADKIIVSTWLNEGYACFCEGAVIKGGRVSFPETGRVDQLLRELPAATALIPKLIKTSHEGFYAGNDQQISLKYATAWGIVYFLCKGVPSNRKYEAYATILPDYWKTLKETRDCEKANAAAFEGVSMEKFQKDFSEFWQKGRNAARRIDPLAANPK